MCVLNSVACLPHALILSEYCLTPLSRPFPVNYAVWILSKTVFASFSLTGYNLTPFSRPSPSNVFPIKWPRKYTTAIGSLRLCSHADNKYHVRFVQLPNKHYNRTRCDITHLVLTHCMWLKVVTQCYEVSRQPSPPSPDALVQNPLAQPVYRHAHHKHMHNLLSRTTCVFSHVVTLRWGQSFHAKRMLLTLFLIGWYLFDLPNAL